MVTASSWAWLLGIDVSVLVLGFWLGRVGRVLSSECEVVEISLQGVVETCGSGGLREVVWTTRAYVYHMDMCSPLRGRGEAVSRVPLIRGADMQGDGPSYTTL